jgi:hypothetical protein
MTKILTVQNIQDIIAHTGLQTIFSELDCTPRVRFLQLGIF